MTLESNALPLNAFEARRWPTHDPATISQKIQTDDFIYRNGVELAGTHMLIDFRGASGLNDLHLMEYALRTAVEAASATILHLHLHHVTPNDGVSGLVILAESRIGVNTWPAYDFATFDIFNWDTTETEKTIPILQAAFQPRSINVAQHLRGTSVGLTSENGSFLQSTYAVSNDPFYAAPRDD